MLLRISRGMACCKASDVMRQFVPSIPCLTYDKYKGQDGKVCVVGGSMEYTGAPYFAAISALLAGADLSHVVCPREAAPVIKSYSPELIVHPLLQEGGEEEIKQWLPRFHSLVLGPGLGRSAEAGRMAKMIIEECKRLGKPLVIDADGIFVVTEDPSLVESNPQVVLTPNRVEFKRLFERLFDGAQPSDDVLEVERLASRLGHVTCVRKGPADTISDGRTTLVCGDSGSPRRCGGQGDVLSGTAALFVYWASLPICEKRIRDAISLPATVRGSYAASCLTRQCAEMAFLTNGRSTTTSDLISNIGKAFKYIFDE